MFTSTDTGPMAECNNFYDDFILIINIILNFPKPCFKKMSHTVNNTRCKIYNLHFRNCAMSQNSESSQNLFTFGFSLLSPKTFSHVGMTCNGRGVQNPFICFKELHQAKSPICVCVCVCSFFFPWKFGMVAVLGILSY